MEGIVHKACVLAVFTCLASATFAAPTASPAPTPKDPRPELVQSAVSANALHLSNLLNPTDKLLEVGMKGFETGFDNAVKGKPDDAAFFQKYPGLREVLMAAAEPVVRKHLAARIPVKQRRFAQFYDGKFSPEEIDQLVTFYSSPTGHKVIEAMYSGTNLDQLTKTIAQQGDKPLTAKDVGELNRAATAHLPDSFDADDWKAIFMFSVTPAHAKLIQIVPEFNQLLAEIENEPDPAMEAEVAGAIKNATIAFMKNKHGRHAS
jgi:hypothetical protein